MKGLKPYFNLHGCVEGYLTAVVVQSMGPVIGHCVCCGGSIGLYLDNHMDGDCPQHTPWRCGIEWTERSAWN